MEDDPFDCPASGNCTDDMPKFVDGHHRQPAQRQEGADQQDLVEAFHWFNCRFRQPLVPVAGCVGAVP